MIIHEWSTGLGWQGQMTLNCMTGNTSTFVRQGDDVRCKNIPICAV
jgi:hypothetical protein